MYEILSSKQDGKRNKFILVGSLMCFLMVSVVAVSIFATQPKPSHISIFSRASTSSPCTHTLYPEVCESLILSTKDGSTPTTLGDMFNLSIKFTIDQAQSIRSLAYNVSRMNEKPDTNSVTALDDCVELLDHSLHHLAKIQDGHKATLSPEDIQTWLSSAITHQSTCLDALQSQKFSKEKYTIDADLQNNIQHISNTLALHKSIVTEESETLKVGRGGRRLLSDDFPTWVSPGERKLLEASIEGIEANAVVATDGTGTHKSIAEALAFVSLAGTGSGRSVIYVKAGTYNGNNLNIPLKQSNVMLVGEGKGKTVITGSKSYGGGSTTLGSATLGVKGDGFIARDITFENSAGPAKHQAVALVVTSDKSVFYRCSIVGYQDTLYTLSNRQFYRETDIYGTVDFIFGNSAVVFQSCNIIGRSPLSYQKNFITAQGRTDPNQNTGISFHKCRISSAKNPTYLGRPWKKYSRTVVMQSYLDGSINSAGWYPWSGGSNPSTIYYGEYMNSGPGSLTSGRVNWPGYHASLSTAEASKFTVGNLISGNSWLPSTGVVFDSGL